MTHIKRFIGMIKSLVWQNWTLWKPSLWFVFFSNDHFYSCLEMKVYRLNYFTGILIGDAISPCINKYSSARWREEKNTHTHSHIKCTETEGVQWKKENKEILALTDWLAGWLTECICFFVCCFVAFVAIERNIYCIC